MSEAPFQTIRQVAKSGLLSEHYLRLRLAQGKLPGFFVGNRFMIDHAALVELLHKEAMQACATMESEA